MLKVEHGQLVWDEVLGQDRQNTRHVLTEDGDRGQIQSPTLWVMV